MKRVLIIGSKGMAGHVIKLFLESLNSYEVYGIARNAQGGKNFFNLDITDINSLEKIIKKKSFDFVINCIGLLNKTAEDYPHLAIWTNSYFPHLISNFGKKYKFKLIHISTDCVFSGSEGCYVESSFRDGNGFYAQSKALGEVINEKDLTFRTSIVGPELKDNGIGLFHWFMNQNKQIFGFDKAYWSGVTTIELAKGINKAIEQDLTGLYHFVNNNKISKNDLLKQLNKVFKNDKLEIISDSKYQVDKSLINTRKDFNYIVPSYKIMINEMSEWIKNHNNLYKY